MIDRKKKVLDKLREVHAVVLLEYHDNNLREGDNDLLTGDSNSINEWIRGELLECIASIESNLENYEIS